jgi:hypothetical protein
VTEASTAPDSSRSLFPPMSYCCPSSKLRYHPVGALIATLISYTPRVMSTPLTETWRKLLTIRPHIFSTETDLESAHRGSCTEKQNRSVDDELSQYGQNIHHNSTVLDEICQYRPSKTSAAKVKAQVIFQEQYRGEPSSSSSRRRGA